MATEENEVQLEQDLAASEAAFSQEFEESPTDIVADETTEEATQELQPELASENVADGEEVDQQPEQDDHARLLALLNEIPERSAMTDKEIRQLHGKFGEINRVIKELQSNSGTANVRVTQDSLKRLNENFPEIAEMLAEDLSGISLQGGGSSFDPEIMQQEVAKVRDEMNQTMQRNLLTIQHRDWASIVGSNEFGKWKDNLSADEQQQLNSSWDAMYLGEKITEFKAWHNKINNTQQQRNQRLANAILPKTTQAASRGIVSEEEAFAAQFR